MYFQYLHLHHQLTMNISNSSNETWTALTEVYTLPLHGKIIIIIICSIVLLIGIIGNIGVLFIIARVTQLHTSLYYALASLALSDLLILVFLPIIPIAELFDISSGFVGKNLCYFLNVSDRGALICSMAIVTFISFERYIAVCHPFHASRMFSRKRTLVTMVIIWTSSYAISMPYIDMTNLYSSTRNNISAQHCAITFKQPWHKVYETALISVFCLAPLVIFVFLYAFMIHSILVLPPKEGAGRDISAVSYHMRRQAVLMVIGVIILFVICIVPFQIFLLILSHERWLFKSLSIEGGYAVIWTARILAYVNSAGNPLVYSAVSSRFRKAIKDAFCCSGEDDEAATTTTHARY